MRLRASGGGLQACRLPPAGLSPVGPSPAACRLPPVACSPRLQPNVAHSQLHEVAVGSLPLSVCTATATTGAPRGGTPPGSTGGNAHETELEAAGRHVDPAHRRRGARHPVRPGCRDPQRARPRDAGGLRGRGEPRGVACPPHARHHRSRARHRGAFVQAVRRARKPDARFRRQQRLLHAGLGGHLHPRPGRRQEPEADDRRLREVREAREWPAQHRVAEHGPHSGRRARADL